MFKQDTLRDKVIDAKEIEQWKHILNEYEKSLKEITIPKKRREDRFKKNPRTDKSITTTEQMININPSPYQYNKQKNHFMLYI